MHFLTEPSCSEGEEEGGGERAQEGNGRGQEVTSLAGLKGSCAEAVIVEAFCGGI